MVGLKTISIFIAVVACAAALSACTVRPLYGDGGNGSGQSQSHSKQQLASIIVSEPPDRVSQQVRNELLFLLRGGAAAPADPAYLLRLRVTSSDIATEVSTQSTRTLGASFDLQDIETGEVIFRGRRAIASAYDIGGQEFALMRARLDAENRAARELAHLVLADIAARMAMQKTSR